MKNESTAGVPLGESDVTKEQKESKIRQKSTITSYVTDCGQE